MDDWIKLGETVESDDLAQKDSQAMPSNRKTSQISDQSTQPIGKMSLKAFMTRHVSKTQKKIIDGGEELRQQYRKMLSAQSRNLVLDCPQLRLVLLGKTGTGKTRLISRVCGKPYQVRLDFGSCLHLF